MRASCATHQRPERAGPGGGHERDQRGQRGAHAPGGLPVLRVVAGDGEADLDARLEAGGGGGRGCFGVEGKVRPMLLACHAHCCMLKGTALSWAMQQLHVQLKPKALHRGHVALHQRTPLSANAPQTRCQADPAQRTQTQRCRPVVWMHSKDSETLSTCVWAQQNRKIATCLVTLDLSKPYIVPCSPPLLRQ